MTKSRDLANAATALNAVTAAELGFVDGVTSAIQTQIDAKLATATAATTYVANSLADAKGDLFVATADNTVTRLPVSTQNGDTIVADSSTSTGLRYQATYEAGKNLLINGLLDIWQRSTSVTGQANGYTTVDRWYLVSSASCTFAQETTIVPAGCRYSQKVTVGASAATTEAYQAVETLNAIAYAGKNVTFSGRFQSTATPTVNITVEYSNDVDKALAVAGWTPITATTGGTGTAGSSSFNTISGVYAIPSTAKSLRFSFATTSMASGAILYYGGFQAELGVVVTSLVRNGATIQGELAACQRYYYRTTGGTAFGALSTYGPCVSTTSAEFVLQSPVTMRTAPTAIEYANLALGIPGSGNVAVTSLGIYTSYVNGQFVYISATVAAGLIATKFAQIICNNNSAGYLGLTAEL